MPTRILTDRFGDTWTTFAGKEAATIRAAIRREQSEALAHGDATGDYSRFRALSDTEKLVGERLAKKGAA